MNNWSTYVDNDLSVYICRHVVGKTVRKVCTAICRQVNDHTNILSN